MIFISDKEIECEKSPVLKAFNNINTRTKFISLGLDLIQQSFPNKKSNNDF
jgi:hypothetical protein